MQQQIRQSEEEEEIPKPVSAFHHFSRELREVIRHQLHVKGKEASFIIIHLHIFIQWRLLPHIERAKYEVMASEDQNRYDTLVNKSKAKQQKRKSAASTTTSSAATDDKMDKKRKTSSESVATTDINDTSSGMLQLQPKPQPQQQTHAHAASTTPVTSHSHNANVPAHSLADLYYPPDSAHSDASGGGTRFHSLRDLFTLPPNSLVSLLGIIVSVGIPKPCNGSHKFCCSFSLIDPLEPRLSCAVAVNFFFHTIEDVYGLVGVGDVMVCRNVRLRLHNDFPQISGNVDKDRIVILQCKKDLDLIDFSSVSEHIHLPIRDVFAMMGMEDGGGGKGKGTNASVATHSPPAHPELAHIPILTSDYWNMFTMSKKHIFTPINPPAQPTPVHSCSHNPLHVNAFASWAVWQAVRWGRGRLAYTSLYAQDGGMGGMSARRVMNSLPITNIHTLHTIAAHHLQTDRYTNTLPSNPHPVILYNHSPTPPPYHPEQKFDLIALVLQVRGTQAGSGAAELVVWDGSAHGVCGCDLIVENKQDGGKEVAKGGGIVRSLLYPLLSSLQAQNATASHPKHINEDSLFVSAPEDSEGRPDKLLGGVVYVRSGQAAADDPLHYYLSRLGAGVWVRIRNAVMVVEKDGDMPQKDKIVLLLRGDSQVNPLSHFYYDVKDVMSKYWERVRAYREKINGKAGSANNASSHDKVARKSATALGHPFTPLTEVLNGPYPSIHASFGQVLAWHPHHPKDWILLDALPSSTPGLLLPSAATNAPSQEQEQLLSSHTRHIQHSPPPAPSKIRARGEAQRMVQDDGSDSEDTLAGIGNDKTRRHDSRQQMAAYVNLGEVGGTQVDSLDENDESFSPPLPHTQIPSPLIHDNNIATPTPTPTFLLSLRVTDGTTADGVEVVFRDVEAEHLLAQIMRVGGDSDDLGFGEVSITASGLYENSSLQNALLSKLEEFKESKKEMEMYVCVYATEGKMVKKGTRSGEPKSRFVKRLRGFNASL
eukprot:gene25656-30987_t